ncbi:MAG: flavin reductase family protein, partial [Planctomycetaceae bacterium]|nr:flavin reductase family protein [Planctomycetaceae bacterium]
IMPRPIAWVSTISPEGRTNLAPFSFFSGVGSRPPSVMFCPANRRDGSPKDTLRNIRQTGEFVINLVSESLAEQMNQTAAELPEEESEFDTWRIAATPSLTVRPLRVAASPVSIECQLLQEINLDSGPGGANIVIGSIRHLQIHDEALDPAGFADPAKLNLIGRMGGTSYVRTSDRFDLPRPE